MKGGMKKQPGHAWNEENNEVHTFVTNDQDRPNRMAFVLGLTIDHARASLSCQQENSDDKKPQIYNQLFTQA